MSGIRTFFAMPIAITKPLEAMLNELSRLRPGLRIVNNAQLHVTLQFLGETAVAQVPDLSAVLQRVAITECITTATIHGLDAFPRLASPAVVWAGFEDSAPLCRLAARLGEECAALGFPRETRPFRPHLTLARVPGRPPRGLLELLSAHRERAFGEVPIETVTLYRSDPGAAGPVYTPLATCRLRLGESMRD